ncbi:hypothetical protein AAZX31_14G100500 [Glycine max]
MQKNLSSSFPSASSSWFEVYAAFSTFMMLLRTALNNLIPHQIRSFIVSKLKSFFSDRQLQHNHEVSLQINQFWDRQTNQDTHRYKSLKVGKLMQQKNIVVALDGKQEVVDQFEDIKLRWKLVESSKEDSDHPKSSEKHSLTLTFDEKHREKLMNKYIPHVLSTYHAMQAAKRTIKIHSTGGSRHCWQKTKLTHPASMDFQQKHAIVDDLDRFLRRKKMYKKVGKPWKRGYLLYGPPRTGKSSLIVAMANYLKFDVYDLELGSLCSNSDLMCALRDMSNHSIVVIEDIDCYREVNTKRFTLSGLLNNMDDLWSSGGYKQIIIFTSNHRERIDPALLCLGRKDMHIHLSFLKGNAFQILASNYLEIEGHHPLFEQIEGLLEKVEVTPAVVAEQLMRNEDPDVALEALVKFLKEMDKEKACI